MGTDGDGLEVCGGRESGLLRQVDDAGLRGSRVDPLSGTDVST